MSHFSVFLLIMHDFWQVNDSENHKHKIILDHKDKYSSIPSCLRNACGQSKLVSKYSILTRDFDI